MGSVIDYIECPRCKQGNCVDDYYYNTGEEYRFCPDCGYHRSFFYQRDENGKLLRKDETTGFDFDNLIPEEVHIENPYGAFRVVTIKGGGTGGVLATEYGYTNFVAEIAMTTSSQEHNIKTATVSRLVNGDIEVEVLFQDESNPDA